MTIDNDGWESKRGKVVNGCLIRGGVFNDFCAEVQQFDGTQVLLPVVGFIYEYFVVSSVLALKRVGEACVK